jgi:1,2-diacylglycerol 3-alpha-glucosyltransferase
MKILHCCLANYYVDGYNYQENVLTKQNKIDGHDVYILASTRTLGANSSIGFTESREYINEDGITVQRIPYKKFIFSNKVNSFKNTYESIEKLAPDIILFHGINSIEILTLIKYKKENPNVKIYIDNHTWYGQAGYKTKLGRISRKTFHRILFKPLLHKSLPYIEKILNVSIDCEDYLSDLYKIPKSKMDLYPLGGNVFDTAEYLERRRNIREELNIDDDVIVYLHSGRLTKYKKTSVLLDAFKLYSNKAAILIIIGKISDDIHDSISEKINMDKRVRYLGWKSANELQNFMCAADIYVQPGNQSASLQNAICCRNAIVVARYKSHELFLRNNGFYADSIEELTNVFEHISDNIELVNKMKEESYEIGLEYLDYRVLANRLY